MSAVWVDRRGSRDAPAETPFALPRVGMKVTHGFHISARNGVVIAVIDDGGHQIIVVRYWYKRRRSHHWEAHHQVDWEFGMLRPRERAKAA